MRRLSDWLLHDASPGAVLLGLLGLATAGLTALAIASGDLSHACNLGQSC